jgi:hypothetical protein
MLSKAAKEERQAYMREYMKEYRRKNPKRTQEQAEQYWERRAAQKLTKDKEQN